MILTAHQTAYLPWAGLIHKILLADKFVFFDCVQMSNDDYERRNRIKTANGEIWLTVPLHSKGYRDKKLYELEIDNSQNWRKKHWDSIRFAYKKAKFFYAFESFFEDMYKQDFQYLTELNEHFLRWLLATLKINVEIVRASDLNFEGQKSDLVLDMCKKLGADIYIFGSQGEGYADIKAFENAGIKLYFQQYECSEYPQLWGNYVSHLSVIDLLFNEGAERSRKIIQQNNISKIQLLEG